jgi:formylglycine-generating enzyme required for sulfatase activity
MVAKPTAQPVKGPVPAKAVAAPTPKAAGGTPVKAAAAPAPKAAGATPAKAAIPAAQAKVQTASPVAASLVLVPEPDLPPDEFVGTIIGKYRIEAKMSETENKSLYRAHQTNIDRDVIFAVLKPHVAANPEMVARFTADARAKAKVSHSFVSAVYEGGESNGIHFYSCEMVPASSLQQLINRGTKLDPQTILQIIKMLGEVLDYFVKENIEHLPVQPKNILLNPGQPPRITNIACETLVKPLDPCVEMRDIGQVLASAMDSSAAAATKAREVTTALIVSEKKPITWAAIAELAASKMPKSAPVDAGKIQAQSIALKKAVVDVKKKNSRRVLIGSIVSLSLTIGACYIIYRNLTKSQVHISDLGAMITIPAGEFQYQDTKVNLPAFAISKYEVTISEYAKFLKFLEAHPEKAKDFDSPKQPKGKSHIPTGWADMKELNPPNPGYYTRVKKWGQFNGAPITLDSPVFGVDWYDAYAYANWIGQRLPTEQEWEKAARGTGSGKFPWGEENKPERANTGIDYTPNPDPKVGGEKDGFKRWSPVNAPKSDRSEYGVYGMAGNVSEWTATFAEDPQLPGDKVPVIRGGNWKTNDASIIRRVLKLSESQSDEGLGFRTAKDIK